MTSGTCPCRAVTWTSPSPTSTAPQVEVELGRVARAGRLDGRPQIADGLEPAPGPYVEDDRALRVDGVGLSTRRRLSDGYGDGFAGDGDQERGVVSRLHTLRHLGVEMARHGLGIGVGISPEADADSS